MDFKFRFSMYFFKFCDNNSSINHSHSVFGGTVGLHKAVTKSPFYFYWTWKCLIEIKKKNQKSPGEEAAINTNYSYIFSTEFYKNIMKNKCRLLNLSQKLSLDWKATTVCWHTNTNDIHAMQYTIGNHFLILLGLGVEMWFGFCWMLGLSYSSGIQDQRLP